MLVAQEHKGHPVDEENQRWKVGDAHGLIRFEDLVLVSLHHVSMGGWQPHLRLRTSVTPSHPVTTMRMLASPDVVRVYELCIISKNSSVPLHSQVSPPVPNDASITNASVKSSVTIAIDAFRHVADRFDMLQGIMSESHVHAQDFMVDVGFVDGHEERTQAVYLYCRKHLDVPVIAQLITLFHPYLFEVLPFPDDVTDGDGDILIEDSEVIDPYYKPQVS